MENSLSTAIPPERCILSVEHPDGTVSLLKENVIYVNEYLYRRSKFSSLREVMEQLQSFMNQGRL